MAMAQIAVVVVAVVAVAPAAVAPRALPVVLKTRVLTPRRTQAILPSVAVHPIRKARATAVVAVAVVAPAVARVVKVAKAVRAAVRPVDIAMRAVAPAYLQPLKPELNLAKGA
jgi:hypothetical protein